GSGSASSRRTISSSAESLRGRGAWVTAITVERIGGEGGFSNTTVTSAPLVAAQRSSMSTSLTIAWWRSRHPASGPGPITFIPATSQRTAQAYEVRRRIRGRAPRYRVCAVSGRVLILSWEYPPVIEGGLARHVRKLAEGMVRQGVAVDVLTRSSERVSPG